MPYWPKGMITWESRAAKTTEDLKTAWKTLETEHIYIYICVYLCFMYVCLSRLCIQQLSAGLVN